MQKLKNKKILKIFIFEKCVASPHRHHISPYKYLFEYIYRKIQEDQESLTYIP